MRKTDEPGRYNTHAATTTHADGVPTEEDVSDAKVREQVDQDPEQVPSWTDEHGGPQDPPTTARRGRD